MTAEHRASGPRDPEIHLRLRAADFEGMNASFLRADVEASAWALQEIGNLRSIVVRRDSRIAELEARLLELVAENQRTAGQA